MGSRIYHLEDAGLAFNPREHTGNYRSVRQIGMGTQSPQEAFEELFPRYPISIYRGQRLHVFSHPITFFNRDKFRSLKIEEYDTTFGDIGNIGRTAISRALRTPSKRTEEYLAKEANVIMDDVLPLIESVARQQNTIDQHVQTCEELEAAFKNLGLR